MQYNGEMQKEVRLLHAALCRPKCCQIHTESWSFMCLLKRKKHWVQERFTLRHASASHSEELCLSHNFVGQTLVLNHIKTRRISERSNCIYYEVREKCWLVNWMVTGRDIWNAYLIKVFSRRFKMFHFLLKNWNDRAWQKYDGPSSYQVFA